MCSWAVLYKGFPVLEHAGAWSIPTQIHWPLPPGRGPVLAEQLWDKVGERIPLLLSLWNSPHAKPSNESLVQKNWYGPLAPTGKENTLGFLIIYFDHSILCGWFTCIKPCALSQEQSAKRCLFQDNTLLQVAETLQKESRIKYSREKEIRVHIITPHYPLGILLT